MSSGKGLSDAVAKRSTKGSAASPVAFASAAGDVRQAPDVTRPSAGGLAAVPSEKLAMLYRLNDTGVASLISNKAAMLSFLSSLGDCSPHIKLSRIAMGLVVELCGSSEGQNAMTTDEVTATAMLKGLLKIATAPEGEPDMVLSALTVVCLTLEKCSRSARMSLGDEASLLSFAAVLRRHADSPRISHRALHIILELVQTREQQLPLIKDGLMHVAAAALEKYMDELGVARVAAEAMHIFYTCLAADPRESARLIALLLAAMRRYSADGDALSDTAAAGRVASAAMQFMSLTANCFAVKESAAAAEVLVAGGNAFVLVACMRKHGVGNSGVAMHACLLLDALARKHLSLACTPLVVAGAVPFLIEAMEAHADSKALLESACTLFASLGQDPATLLQLAEERPVLMLRKLLERHRHNAPILVSVLSGGLGVVAKLEAARSTLMDGAAAAAETTRLLVEISRFHLSSPDADSDPSKTVAWAALQVLNMLCCTHDDYIAAHEAGACSAALELMRKRGADERTASIACNLLNSVAVVEAAGLQLLHEGGPAALFKVLARHHASADVARLGCGALLHCLQASVRPDDATLRGACTAAMGALRKFSDNASVVSHAASCFVGVASRRPDLVVELGAAPLLVRALRLHAGKETAACSALTALLAISSVETSKGVGAVAEALPIPELLAVLEKHGEDDSAAYAACTIILRLATWPASSDAVTRSMPAVLAAVTRALRHHMVTAKVDTVAAGACTTLLALSSNAHNVPHFASGGVIPSLLSVVRRYAATDAASRVLVCRAAAAAAAALVNVATVPACLALMRSMRAGDVFTAVLACIGDADGEAETNLLRYTAHLTEVLSGSC